KFVDKIITENLSLISKFVYCFLSFDFHNLEIYTNEPPLKNDSMMEHFKNILRQNSPSSRLENISLSQHITYNFKNKKTGLDDQFDFYDCTYYDKTFESDVYNMMLYFKFSKTCLRRIYKRKVVMV